MGASNVEMLTVPLQKVCFTSLSGIQ